MVSTWIRSRCVRSAGLHKNRLTWEHHFTLEPFFQTDMAVSENPAKTDEQLASVVIQRDDSQNAFEQSKASFEELYQRHSRMLLAFLSSRVSRNDVDDVHQAVWQKMWQSMPSQFRGGNFRAWMHQIARNHLIDLSRKRRPDAMPEGPEIADASSSADPLEESERQEALSRCLEHLRDDLAKVVKARLSGVNYETICQQMGIKSTQAHKLFFTAREQLTGCVQQAFQ